MEQILNLWGLLKLPGWVFFPQQIPTGASLYKASTLLQKKWGGFFSKTPLWEKKILPLLLIFSHTTRGVSIPPPPFLYDPKKSPPRKIWAAEEIKNPPPGGPPRTEKISLPRGRQGGGWVAVAALPPRPL